MKSNFHLSILVLLLAALFFVVMPALAQEAEETETVPTEAVVDVVAAPVAILDQDATVAEVFAVWLGWVVAVFFAGTTFFFAKDSAAKGNKMAELGLKFFEASKDMIPFDKYQYQFEQMARRTATPIDNIMAAATGAIGNELGLLNRTGVGESAIDGVPHEAQSR